MNAPIMRSRGNCITCGRNLLLRDDGTARRHRVNEADREWCAGSRQLPAAEPEPVLDHRAQWIAGARAVLDLLESNPDLPMNLVSGMSINYYPINAASDEQAMAAVDAVAKQLGVAVTPPGRGSHYEARIDFGPASYRAVAVLSDYSERRAAIDRLGAAALAEQEAAQAVEHVDYAEAEAVREIEREMAIEAGDDSELDRQVAEDDARNGREFEAQQANEAWLDAHPDDYIADADALEVESEATAK